MRYDAYKLPACLLLGLTSIVLHAQTASPSAISADARVVPLEQRLEMISSALDAARQQLDQSQQQIRLLQQELAEIKHQVPSSNSSSSVADPLAALQTSCRRYAGTTGHPGGPGKTP